MMRRTADLLARHAGAVLCAHTGTLGVLSVTRAHTL
jgi:hypothetical protein